MRNELGQDHLFKQMYKRLFDLYNGTHTTLDMDVAEQLWVVYLPKKMTFFK